MSLKILSVTKVPPAAPYGDATRKRPLIITVELPNGKKEKVRVHEANLDEFIDNLKRKFPDMSGGAILAVLWGLWKHRKRGASIGSLLNVDIEQ